MFLRQLSLAAGLAACAGSQAEAGEMVRLMLAPNGGSAELVFKQDMQANDAFMVRLSRLAVPGSRFKISIDRDKHALYDRLIAPEECTFADGPAMCLIPITGGTAEFATLVRAFKAGRLAHLEITNAGHRPIKSDTSLRGFTKAFGAL